MLLTIMITPNFSVLMPITFFYKSIDLTVNPKATHIISNFLLLNPIYLLQGQYPDINEVKKKYIYVYGVHGSAHKRAQ